MFTSGLRHSAVFLETKPIVDKGDGAFSRSRRSSETTASGLVRKPDSDLLDPDRPDIRSSCDFDVAKESKTKIRDNSKGKHLYSSRDFKKTEFPSRPRREKTDGEIVLRSRNEKRLDLRDELEAKRLEVEERFSKDSERNRRRSNMTVASSFEGGNVNGGFNGSLNDFQSSFDSLSSFSDLQFQVSF